MIRTTTALLALVLCLGCSGTDDATPDTTPETTPKPEVTEAPPDTAPVVALYRLGKREEGAALAKDLGLDLDAMDSWDWPKEEAWVAVESREEQVDGGDAPLVAGCVCCYSDQNCTTIIGRSVDECWPRDGDSLSENISAACEPNGACAERKDYKCSEVLPGSTCEVLPMTCCGVATTSAYCKPIEL